MFKLQIAYINKSKIEKSDILISKYSVYMSLLIQMLAGNI